MKNIYYSIKNKTLLKKFTIAIKDLNIKGRKIHDIKNSRKDKAVLLVMDEDSYKEGNLLFKNKNSIYLVILIGKKTASPENKNIVLDFVHEEIFEASIKTRLIFNLSILSLFHDQRQTIENLKRLTSISRSHEILKINREREKTLLELTDKITRELNQPLTTLLCNAEVLKGEAKKSPSLLKKAERIIESGSRITESVKKIQSLKLCQEEGDKSSPARIEKKFKILCIEPDDGIIKKLEFIYNKINDIEITYANSYKNAGLLINNELFDLIFTEQRILNQTIGSFLEKIKGKNIPDIIIFTDAKGKNDRINSETNCGIEYLLKNQISQSSIERIITRVKEKARLEKKLNLTRTQLQELPMRDDLTGLYNKRWFFEILPKEMSRARRYDTGLTICMGGVSEYFSIREKLGYLSGDRLLTIISSILHSNSRKSDFCCRYDNSFAIVLPNTDLKGGGVFTGRINATLSEKNFFYEDTKTDINMEWGVCQFDPLTHPTAGAMVESAFSFTKSRTTNKGGNDGDYFHPGKNKHNRNRRNGQ